LRLEKRKRKKKEAVSRTSHQRSLMGSLRKFRGKGILRASHKDEQSVNSREESSGGNPVRGIRFFEGSKRVVRLERSREKKKKNSLFSKKTQGIFDQRREKLPRHTLHTEKKCLRRNWRPMQKEEGIGKGGQRQESSENTNLFRKDRESPWPDSRKEARRPAWRIMAFCPGSQQR